MTNSGAINDLKLLLPFRILQPILPTMLLRGIMYTGESPLIFLCSWEFLAFFPFWVVAPMLLSLEAWCWEHLPTPCKPFKTVNKACCVLLPPRGHIFLITQLPHPSNSLFIHKKSATRRVCVCVGKRPKAFSIRDRLSKMQQPAPQSPQNNMMRAECYFHMK